MRLIDPSYEILEQQDGLQGVYKQIELAGRTCYKSEDKITDESAEKFVQRMIDSGHTAMLEHGTVYFYIKREEDGGINPNDPFEIDFDTIFCKYGQHKTNFETHETFFTTNLRWLVEQYPNDWKKIYKYYARTPDERWPKRRTVKLTTSLHVYKDLTRHRKASFAIESTRYCNYSKGKFGSELTFIRPCWDIGGSGMFTLLEEIEETYLSMISEHNWQAQQAAEILPQCVKADVIITAFDDDWEHMFNLRAKGTTGKPHPEVQRIMIPLMNEFISRKYIDDTFNSTDNSSNNSDGNTPR